MPPRLPAGQPDGTVMRHGGWFESAAGQAILESEAPSVQAALNQRPGQLWLVLTPSVGLPEGEGPGLRLQASGDGWTGPVRCALPLPLANESVATVVLQHTGRPGKRGAELIEECARVLVPGGQLWVYALNPLSPYRWRWRGSGLRAADPSSWRRRLRAAGLQPDAMSEGIGPLWSARCNAVAQQGPGVRAAYVLRAEKRTVPLTPLRQRAPLRLGEGVPAA